MKRLLYIFLILIFPCNWAVYAQINLSELTVTITDTTQPKVEQAKNIYDWITNNITYDFKSYQTLTPRNLSPEQTLKVRKGLSYEYAGLMTALCKSVGIEAYTVFGYTKDFDYYSNKVFLHLNHCWSVINTGTEWIIADPTWGSGYLVAKSVMRSKIFNKSGSKTKLNFLKQYNPDYYNIPSADFLKTHYPLDPKWLFENNPPSYKAFESGYADSSLISINWVAEIQKIRGIIPINVMVIEGETALRYNENNLFDYGMAIHSSIPGFDAANKLTTNDIDQINEINSKCTKVTSLLASQRIITDSVYKERFSILKEFSSNQVKTQKIIEKEAIAAQKSYRKNKDENIKKTKGVYEKIVSLELKIKELENTHLKESNNSTETKTDLIKERDIKIAVSDREKQQFTFETSLDSLHKVMDYLLTLDAILNDSILLLYSELNNEFQVLKQVIDSGNEETINDRSDSIWNKFTMCTYLLNRKKGNSTDIDITLKSYKETKNSWETSLKEDQAQLREMYKTTHHADDVYDVYKYSLSQNIIFCESQIEFENRVLSHLGLQQGFIYGTRKQLKHLSKINNSEYKHFENWYNKTYNWENLNFRNDKKVISLVLKDTSRKSKVISNIMK